MRPPEGCTACLLQGEHPHESVLQEEYSFRYLHLYWSFLQLSPATRVQCWVKKKRTASLGQQCKITAQTRNGVWAKRRTLSRILYLRHTTRKFLILIQAQQQPTFWKSLTCCKKKHSRGSSFQEGPYLNPFQNLHVHFPTKTSSPDIWINTQ